MSNSAAELTIKLTRGPVESVVVQVPDLDHATVLQLKQIISERDPAAFPVIAQRLIFQGQILQDGKHLKDYNITRGCAVHMALSSAASTGSSRGTVAPSTSVGSDAGSASAAGSLQILLNQMRHEQGFQTAVETLQRICDNIMKHPHEEKYRKLRLANAALKSKLFDRSKGIECVKVMGFEEGVEDGFLVLVPSASKWEALTAFKRVLDDSVAQSNRSSQPSTSFSNAFGAPPGAGMNDFGSMASQTQAMLQNPMMAQMLQNHPMRQQMAQLNPMIAQALQNPSMLSQQLQMLQQNPAMMQMMNQMMQDPQALNNLQQMMLGGAGNTASPSLGSFGAGSTASNPFAFPGSGSFGSVPASSSASNTTNPFAPPSGANAAAPSAPAPALAHTSSAPPSTAQAPASSAGSDAAASFDEDEIANAIARSLEDHPQ